MRLSQQREFSPPLKDAGTEGATREPGAGCRARAAPRAGAGRATVLCNVLTGERQRTGNTVESGHQIDSSRKGVPPDPQGMGSERH